MSCSRIERCRLCGGSDFDEIIDLGEQANSSMFPQQDEPDPPKYPLILDRCQTCGLVQLRHSVDPSLLYTHSYGYRSGINQTMSNHLGELVGEIEKIVRFSNNPIVLDIGCNDGTTLRAYRTPGLTCIGIDPIAEHFNEYFPEEFLIREDYFSAECYEKVTSGKKADVISSIAVFYDLEQPNDFVADIATCLAPEGIWVLEQSYLPTMLNMTSFDTVCHEHLEYYCLEQIRYMADTNGLRIFKAELNNANGGSIRVFVCHKNATYIPIDNSVAKLLEWESASGFDGLGVFYGFGDRTHKIIDQLTEFISHATETGKTVYGYGASTKGNVILQSCGLNHRSIVAMADRNPEKWGRFTPGTRIPIISEKQARLMEPDYFLVLPWHFRQEFMEREIEFLARGGQFIFPLPILEITS